MHKLRCPLWCDHKLYLMYSFWTWTLDGLRPRRRRTCLWPVSCVCYLNVKLFVSFIYELMYVKFVSQMMGHTNLMYVPSVWDCGIRESDSGALSFVRFLKSEVWPSWQWSMKLQFPCAFICMKQQKNGQSIRLHCATTTRQFLIPENNNYFLKKLGKKKKSRVKGIFWLVSWIDLSVWGSVWRND